MHFFVDASISENILVRVRWLDRVRLRLVDHDTTLYLAPYEAEWGSSLVATIELF